MGIREDSEKFSLRVMDGSLPMGPATVIAWAFVMSNIITELCKDDPMPYRYRLAVSTMERWGMVLPHTATPKDQAKLFVGEQVKDLRKLFDEAWHTATMVRIFRPLLELDERERSQTREHDEATILEIRNFCRARTDRIDEFGSDEVTCEWREFMALIGHMTNLMRVVLGEKDWATFRSMHDEGMAALTQIRDLAQAPPQ